MSKQKIILIIIIIILALGFGYKTYAILILQRDISDLDQIDTSLWSKYSNQELGIEFKLPENIGIEYYEPMNSYFLIRRDLDINNPNNLITGFSFKKYTHNNQELFRSFSKLGINKSCKKISLAKNDYNFTPAFYKLDADSCLMRKNSRDEKYMYEKGKSNSDAITSKDRPDYYAFITNENVIIFEITDHENLDLLGVIDSFKYLK